MWKMKNSLDISKYTNNNKEKEENWAQKKAKKIVAPFPLAIWWKTMCLFTKKNEKKKFFRFTEIMNI